MLQVRNGGTKYNVKPVAAAAPVRTAGASEMLSFIPSVSCEAGVLAEYAPFIWDGFVSLVGSDVKVPIKILRDTGAYDSYIVDYVLTLLKETDTGDCILSQGMGLTVLSIPLHKMILSCELVQGEVSVGVRSALPIEGVQFILGNGLAGGRVWADTPHSPVVKLSPVDSQPNSGSDGLHDVPVWQPVWLPAQGVELDRWLWQMWNVIKRTWSCPCLIFHCRCHKVSWCRSSGVTPH